MDFPKPQDLELPPPKRGWTVRWNNIDQPELLVTRPARLKDAITYLRGNAYELAYGKPGTVIDLCPEAGELLEVLQALGHTAYAINNYEGGRYADACDLLLQRRNISLDLRGLLPYVEYEAYQQELIEKIGGTVRLVVCRTKFERALPFLFQLQDGCVVWRLSQQCLDQLQRFFSLVQQLLTESGLLLLTVPCVLNQSVANNVIRSVAQDEGLQLVRANGRHLTWRRI